VVGSTYCSDFFCIVVLCCGVCSFVVVAGFSCQRARDAVTNLGVVNKELK
jgi:hypothetical protein